MNGCLCFHFIAAVSDWWAICRSPRKAETQSPRRFPPPSNPQRDSKEDPTPGGSDTLLSGWSGPALQSTPATGDAQTNPLYDHRSSASPASQVCTPVSQLPIDPGSTWGCEVAETRSPSTRDHGVEHCRSYRSVRPPNGRISDTDAPLRPLSSSPPGLLRMMNI